MALNGNTILQLYPQDSLECGELGVVVEVLCSVKWISRYGHTPREFLACPPSFSGNFKSALSYPTEVTYENQLDGRPRVMVATNYESLEKSQASLLIGVDKLSILCLVDMASRSLSLAA